MRLPSDYITQDYSNVRHGHSYALANRKDNNVRVGVVRSAVEIDGPDIAYNVEVWIDSRWVPIQCTRLCRFGGVYNYEEYTYRGYEPGGLLGQIDYRPGDNVLVAYIDGSSHDGVILGSFNHPARPRLFNEDSDVVYESEFNGLNKSITKDGEYTVTYKGLQTNIGKLKEKAIDGEEIPAPEYNEEIGGSYYRFELDGSFKISDDNDQSIFIDKSFGKIVVTSGNTSLTIDKEAESYDIVNKTTTINSADSFTLETKATTVNSTDVVDVTSAAINTTGELTQTGNVTIEGNTTQTGNVKITGNFENTGTAKLGGGAHPLVYDIYLTLGVGNLGAPVISGHILARTVKTKAT